MKACPCWNDRCDHKIHVAIKDPNKLIEEEKTYCGLNKWWEAVYDARQSNCKKCKEIKRKLK